MSGRGANWSDPASWLTLGVMLLLLGTPIAYQPQWLFQLNTWLATKPLFRIAASRNNPPPRQASPHTVRIIGIVMVLGGITTLIIGLAKL